MSEGSPAKDQPPSKESLEITKPFICASEASALLNCVADPQYNEHKCLPLLKQLRACVKKNSSSRASSASIFNQEPILSPMRPGARVAVVTGVGITVFLTVGRYVMYATNPELKHDKSYEDDHLRQIKSQQSDRSKITTDRNRQSLEQMFEELKSHSDEERYRTALKGKILNSKSLHKSKDQ